MSQHLLEWLPAYHDGELGQDRRRLVEAHLEECESCRTELKALEPLSSHLKAERAPEFTPAARFTARPWFPVDAETMPFVRSAAGHLRRSRRFALGTPLG